MFLMFELHTFKNIQTYTLTTDKFCIDFKSHAAKFSEYYSFWQMNFQ